MIRITVPRDKLNIRIADYKHIPNGRGGVYRIYGRGNKLLYVGKAANLRDRIRQHFKGTTNTSSISHKFKTVRLFYEPDPVKRDLYETHLINKLKPPMNIEKTFTYTSKRTSTKPASKQPKRKRTTTKRTTAKRKTVRKRRKTKPRKGSAFWLVFIALLVAVLLHSHPAIVHLLTA